MTKSFSPFKSGQKVIKTKIILSVILLFHKCIHSPCTMACLEAIGRSTWMECTGLETSQNLSHR